MKYLLFSLLLLIMLILVYCFYYAKWNHLWALEQPSQKYQVNYHQKEKDSLRVVMIGDSWVGMHSDFDNFMIQKLEKYSRLPVLFVSKGKGGEKTKGVYQLMFKEGSYGTKQLMLSAPDYCVISAGINDAAANLGTKQFCYYYRLILDFLLENHIRPVVIEVPNVDLWLMLRNKPIKDLASDYVKSIMTNCTMYNYQEYRNALLSMLESESLKEQILYIPMKEWNGNEVEINRSLFLEDCIHLNKRGYESIDSCIAKHIANDYALR